MRPGFALLGLALLALPPVPASAEGAGPVILAPHRAVYKLSLLRSGGGAKGVEAADGGIAFDFGGDACEGYTLKYRQVTVLDYNETGSRTLDMRSATYEGGDGKTIRFKTDSRMEGIADNAVDGDAELRGDGIAIRLKQPKRETLNLPGPAVFPSEHLKRIIEAARAGQATLSLKVYDGSDSGKRLHDTLALIGRRIEPGPAGNVEEPAKQDTMTKLARWPVTISYFVVGSDDQTPAYTISFELYENGISRALKLDYGDFILKGDLQNLELQTASACQR